MSFSSSHRRRGAVAVEFAAVAPLLLVVVAGMIELRRVDSVKNALEDACRAGARSAIDELLPRPAGAGSTNQRVERRIKEYLAASGIDPTQVQVFILRADRPGESFDLDDPTNQSQMFQVRVDVPYAAVSCSPVSDTKDECVSAALTFRTPRATPVEMTPPPLLERPDSRQR
jgi:hypothetical protein